MKKKLVAMLVAAAMLVCMMPAMAFADEAPAEEQVVQATEEVVVPEAAEEEAVAPETEGAVLEEEAVVEETELEAETATFSGYWDGYVFYFTGNEAGAADCWVEIEGTSIDYTIKVGANDLTSEITSDLERTEGTYASSYVTIMYPTKIKSLLDKFSVFGECLSNREFFAMKAKVAVDKAASQDTIFTYALDSLIIEKYDAASETVKWYTLDPTEDDATKDFFGNTITLKAGETTAEGFLHLSYGYDWEDEETAPDDLIESYRQAGFTFKEEGNDGGYTTDPSLWAWTFVSYNFDDYGQKYAKFANRAELQAFLDKFNEVYTDKNDEALELYEQTFTYSEMTYTHTVEAKGVQTGDSNSLGLWVVVMAVAGVAAAAVALKRREN